MLLLVITGKGFNAFARSPYTACAQPRSTSEQYESNDRLTMWIDIDSRTILYKGV